MAAPLPPQGAQTTQTERPRQVYAEQYVEGQPLPIGAVINPLGSADVPLYTDGLPRVRTPLDWVVVQPTDYVISSRYSGAVLEVVSAEEYAERYVGPGELG